MTGLGHSWYNFQLMQADSMEDVITHLSNIGAPFKVAGRDWYQLWLGMLISHFLDEGKIKRFTVITVADPNSAHDRVFFGTIMHKDDYQSFYTLELSYSKKAMDLVCTLSDTKSFISRPVTKSKLIHTFKLSSDLCDHMDKIRDIVYKH